MSIFLSRSSKHSTAKHMTRDTKNYYVPAESNNPTFDGFLHGCDSANTLHAFQTTLGSKHYMKTEGLRKLVKSGYPNAPIQLIFLVVPGSNFTVPRPPKEYESQFRFFTCEMEFRSSFEFPLQPVDKMEVELESVEFE
ncbi:hypothetical protein DL96DRAFT_1556851 [Flagelloscypha sp. PMI_526]|nr:hypothetical protein DL96DRAFT_1556851 [Flagelloscypha sp. PMI_526]